MKRRLKSHFRKRIGLIRNTMSTRRTISISMVVGMAVLIVAAVSIRRISAQYSTGTNADLNKFESAGKRSITLKELKQQAEDKPLINSLLISVDDSILSKFYFNGLGKEETVNIKSASKSLLSALVGIALEQGHIDSVDQPIEVYLNDYFQKLPDNAETEKKRTITIRDLLLMSSGLKSTSGPSYGRWVISDDWTLSALKQPIVNEPGEEVDYSTGDSHLLSAVLTRATGMSTYQFAQKHIFRPMGMKCGDWQRSPEGFHFGGNNMSLRPIDMLRFGRLYLEEGRHQGRQILPEHWVLESVRPFKEYRIRGRETGQLHQYGYLWWHQTFHGYHAYFAWGYGGQYIFIIEELDSVVVVTHQITNNSGYGNYREQTYAFLEEWIIPFIEERQNAESSSDR